MPPSIITNQARARLPSKWMASHTPATAVITPSQQQQQDTFRWSTHTLAPDSAEQHVKGDYAPSPASSPYSSFVTRRKSRISNLTCVDLLDDDTCMSSVTTSKDNQHEGLVNVNPESEEECDDLSARVDLLMASTMQALETSNQLVLDTLETRSKLAQLRSAEAMLDSDFTSREASLLRQIQAMDAMSDFVSRKCLELQHLTSPSSSAVTSTKATEHARVNAQDAGVGIVQALDRDATIGKTAAGRLEKMLQGPASPNAASRRSTSGSRRTFSVNTFGPTHSSIAEEERSQPDSQSSLHATSTEVRTPMASPSKKRSVSYDITSERGTKLMPTLAGPSRAVSSSRAAPTARPSSSASRSAQTDFGPSSHNAGNTSAITSSSSAGSAETSLAALLGRDSRTETPSDHSYFDSSLEDSVTSASPSTPGSVHAIHDVLFNVAVPPSRRSSGMHTGTRASFSLSERDKSSDPYQLAQLRAEQVTWHSNGATNRTHTDDSTKIQTTEALGGGGALRALQRLNDMTSGAKAASHPSHTEDTSTRSVDTTKRVSLGLGMPGFSALKPITNRAPSAPVVISGAADEQQQSQRSSRPSGWKPWSPWSSSSTAQY